MLLRDWHVRKIMKNRNWFDAQLNATMLAIERGSPKQIVAFDFDIPRTTLRDHVMGFTFSWKGEKNLIFTLVEEEKVAKYIMGMARYGHSINITVLKVEVVEATQLRETPFKDEILGVG
jgi:hypothetical protein